MSENLQDARRAGQRRCAGGAMLALDADMRTAIRGFLPRYPTRQAVVLPALHVVNERLGYVPRRRWWKSPSCWSWPPPKFRTRCRFYGFFKQDQPQGRYRVWVCRSISCAACGGEELLDYLAREAGHSPRRNHAPTAG